MCRPAIWLSIWILAGCLYSSSLAQNLKEKAAGIKAWDKNRDGLIQQNEVPPVHRAAVRKWAAKLELDPDQPLPVDRLLQDKAAGKKVAKSTARAAGKADAKTQSNEVPEKAAEPARARKVAGFGNAQPNDAVDSKSNEDAKNDSKESAAEKRRRRHFEMLARSLLYQNDKNRNGKLERNEWTRLKGNPSASDRDKNGVLTKDELAIHLQGFGKRERDVTKRRTVHSTRARKNKQGKSYRFLTPHERLPEGLPDWFTERDANLDGQISLAEFETDLTAAKVAKFRQLDLNNDGLLVAKEYLQATNIED